MTRYLIGHNLVIKNKLNTLILSIQEIIKLSLRTYEETLVY